MTGDRPHLRTARSIDDADDSVGRRHRHLVALGARCEIEHDIDGAGEHVGHEPLIKVDQPHVAIAARFPAGDGERPTVCQEGDRENPLAKVADPLQERSFAGIEDEQFVIAAYHQLSAIGREGECGDGDGMGIGLGRRRMRARRHDHRQRLGRLASVERPARGDPTADRLDRSNWQWIRVRGHPLVGVARSEPPQDLTAGSGPSDDRLRARVTRPPQLFERIESIPTLGLLWSMAGDAVVHENGRDVALEADRLSGTRQRMHRPPADQGQHAAVSRTADRFHGDS